MRIAVSSPVSEHNFPIEDDAWLADPMLVGILHEAMVSLHTLGLILSGSRAIGDAQTNSDYDLFWVLSDAAFTSRQEGTDPLHVRRATPNLAMLDIIYTCPRELAAIAAEPGWWTPGYAGARVLLDKTGDITYALQQIVTIAEEAADAEAAAAVDAYFNAFHHSLKAWRRGDELGGRLQAADAAMHLIRALFYLERRWPPYLDHLSVQLDTLNSQGWPQGALHGALLSLLSSGDPRLQLDLEARVEVLLRARGFGHIIDGWGETLERAKAQHF